MQQKNGSQYKDTQKFKYTSIGNEIFHSWAVGQRTGKLMNEIIICVRPSVIGILVKIVINNFKLFSNALLNNFK